MSGGHWDYASYRVAGELTQIAEDPEVVRRFPRLAKALAELETELHDIILDMEWDLSGDSPILNDKVFERIALGRLGMAVEQ